MKRKTAYWLVTREYSGLAEAGGVKDVSTSLARELNCLGLNVTVFIPLYGSTCLDHVVNFDIIEHLVAEIKVDSKLYRVMYAQGFFNGIRIVFIVNSNFTSKMGVYTYTRLEEALNSSYKSGQGHQDSQILNILFQRAVLHYGILSKEDTTIIHCQDSHSALIPFIAHKDLQYTDYYSKTKFFVTIHNAGNAYRSQLPSVREASQLLEMPKDYFEDFCIARKPEPFLLSQNYATFTTVSPWHAKELTDPNYKCCDDISLEFYNRNVKILGITNGIAHSFYNPEKKEVSLLPFEYNPLKKDLEGKQSCREYFLKKYSKVHICSDLKKIDRIIQYGTMSIDCSKKLSEKPVYFSFHGRIVHQKGIDVFVEAANLVLSKNENARFIVMGQGVNELEELNVKMSLKFPEKFIFFQGYDSELSRLCVAVSDFLVLPSFFEPCGLEDFIAQIYGTIPIAHACGGLNKIIHEKTGFLFYNNDALTLSNLLLSLIDRIQLDNDFFKDMISYSSNYIKQEYSWGKVISENYIPLFKK